MSVTCCPLSGDGDGPSCSTSTRPKARKEYRCCECQETIAVGSVYERIKGIWDGIASTFKTCLSCAEIRDHFACDGATLGYLWRDLESPSAKGRLFERRMAWLEAS